MGGHGECDGAGYVRCKAVNNLAAFVAAAVDDAALIAFVLLLRGG